MSDQEKLEALNLEPSAAAIELVCIARASSRDIDKWGASRWTFALDTRSAALLIDAAHSALRAEVERLTARVAELASLAQALRLAGITISRDGEGIYCEDMIELATAVEIAAQQEST